jgi:hypothetical protein
MWAYEGLADAVCRLQNASSDISCLVIPAIIDDEVA